ncbi:MAG: M14 family metallopeptidase [Gemmatimonadales bacterium]
MRPSFSAACAALLATVVPSLWAQQPARAADLGRALTPGFLLADENGDGLIDYVPARLVLPRQARAGLLAAAANVAARLGYETTGLDLGRTSFDSVARGPDPVILVGRDALGTGGPRPGPALRLAPGEGAVLLLPPGPAWPGGGLLLDGGDDSGLLAAAGYFASRFPSVWSTRGTGFTDLGEKLGRLLREQGTPGDTARLTQIVVAAGTRGVSRAQYLIRVADSVAMRRAARMLRADSTPRPAGDSARSFVKTTDLETTDLHRLDVVLQGGGVADTVVLRPRKPWPAAAGTEPASRANEAFSLADLYAVGGLYRDGNQDLVPDQGDIALSLSGSGGAAGLVDFAARIGLETAGLRLPIASVSPTEERIEDRGFPILFGLDHPRAAALTRDRTLQLAGGPAGEGFAELVPRAFGGKAGLVVSGTDAAGLDAIAAWLAGRAPWLWTPGKGEYQLSDLETEVRRFVQARSGAGQLALGVHKLDRWLDRLPADGIDSVAVELAVKDRPDGLDRFLDGLLRQRLPRARRSVTTFDVGFGVGRPVFEDTIRLPWEVDSVWTALRGGLFPRLGSAAAGSIEVRVSESPQVRERLRAAIRDSLAAHGADPARFTVTVLSAYKQGYSWLTEVVAPSLRGKRVGRIEIRYRNLKDSDEVKWQAMGSDTRWLQEIYPVDAVLARDLGLTDSAVTFVPTFSTAVPVYGVRVTDPAGAEIYAGDFDPKYVIRPFFDLFPEYEQVQVTTGWVTASLGADRVVDRRVRTDPEMFWDRLQTDVYGRIVDYVMDIQDGKPSPANAPYFDEFTVDLTMSEPDYRIGVDEEVISSLEALHEDIYFETLVLFDLIGNRYGVGPLNYAGRILPRVSPSREGRAGEARVRFTGKERGIPELVLVTRRAGGEAVRERYSLTPLGTDAPVLRGAAVAAGASGPARMLFEVTVRDSADRFAEFRDRASEGQYDRNLPSADLVSGMVGAMGRLHLAGVAETALSFDRIGALVFTMVSKDTAATPFRRSATLVRSRRPGSTERPHLAARGFRYTGQRLVQWDTPIPPAESDSIVARLGTFPVARPYFVTQSFLGQNTFAIDFLPAQRGRYLSQAKLNALKPTVFISGRQHANEVSSTSHILRLGELLATDTAYRRLLDKVNVVLHPITNADGARLAWEMQRITPDFMLHAGYLGALGVDVTAQSGSDDPVYPESKARPVLEATWLPDISMNMHGYPSHEWVQYFAGYSAWVRNRLFPQRSWWSPRGWFVPGFSWTDDSRYPEIQKAQFAILDSVARSITGDAEIEAMNRRLYARYRKYGAQDVENFREDFYQGILVYRAVRGRPATGPGGNNARITYFSTTTEAPDETARGAWLELVARAGLNHSSALIRYLATGANRVERESTDFEGYVSRRVFRKKPVLPAEPGGTR